MKRGILVLLLLAGCAPDPSAIDGDTLRLVDNSTINTRLFGIDAPEIMQDCQRADGSFYQCGREAKAYLVSLIKGHEIKCHHQVMDKYGRSVAICYAYQSGVGIDISAAMVRAGWAVAYTHYTVKYLPQEIEAKAAKRGLWQGEFMVPFEWRTAHKR